MAAWTKNEGMLFALVFAIACVVRGKRVLPWIFGALPGFVMLAWFKLTLAPSSDLAQPIAVIVGNLVDASRHAAVVQALPGAAGWWWTPPLVLLTYQVTGTWRNPDTRIALALIALMLAGYYLVYVTSPHAQAWHVETSFARLLVHLWPIGILAGTCVVTQRSRPVEYPNTTVEGT